MRARILAAAAAVVATAAAAQAAAQTPDSVVVASDTTDFAVPPPGGLVPRERVYALGLGLGLFSWGDLEPFESHPLVSLSIERNLLSWLRGRAGLAYGTTTMPSGFRDVDFRVMSFDLQVAVGPSWRTAPYALAGVGSVVTNPEGFELATGEAADLPTRSQTIVTYGGGIRTRLGDRWEVRGEGVVGALRLADPLVAEERETDTIHITRWEGSLQWLF